MSASVIQKKIRARRALPSPAEAKDLRERAGLSQQEAADHLKVSRSIISLWEAGMRTPSGPHLLAYVAFLELLRRETK